MKFEHHIHSVPSKPMAWMKEDYESEHGFSQSNVEEYKSGLTTVIDKSLLHSLFVQGCLLNTPREQTIRHLFDYLQAVMMELQPYINKGRDYSVSFHGKMVLKEAQPLDKLYFSEWLHAFYATLILRDPFGQLKDLISIDESDFVVNQHAGNNDIDLVLYRLYQGFFGQGKKDLTTLIGDVIEFSAPEFVGDDEAQDFVNYLYLPLTQMLVYAHTKDRAVKFPEKLIHALESHRRYYTDISGNPTDVCSIWGWLSLGITAFAAHAYDAFGLEPNVDTEYMPKWLVKGEFPSYKEAFPELTCAPDPQYKNFEFTASCKEVDIDWRPIWLETIKWAKEEVNLPPMCDVIGRDVVSQDVEKTLQGEIFTDVLGDNPPELKLYSMEASLINNPDAWLEEMKIKWCTFISRHLPDASITVQFVE